jgi:hypothetical protein
MHIRMPHGGKVMIPFLNCFGGGLGIKVEYLKCSLDIHKSDIHMAIAIKVFEAILAEIF